MQAPIWEPTVHASAGGLPKNVAVMAMQRLSHEEKFPTRLEGHVPLERGEETRVAIGFDSYRGRYLLHCHNLQHEDHAMMARFDVV
jgi:FtsP/CotA-like multicopper oxidase with cupredoxin domain